MLVAAERVAWSQGGVLLAGQADGCGVSGDVRRRLVGEGSWRRIVKGLYAIGADSWQQRAWAGVLIGGPQAALGHEAALHLAGLGPEPDQITVFVGRQAGFPRDERWRFIRSFRQGYGAPPCTSLASAIIDVGAHWPVDDLLTVVGAAVTGRRVTAYGLRAELATRARHPQRWLMSSVIDDVDTGTTTVLESRYRELVETAHGLPSPRRQAKPVGRYRVDNWYEPYKLIVEVDGRATHVGLAAAIDMDRDNLHTSHGITTLRFTWSHVTRAPCETARVIAQALARAGWPGPLRPCHRCDRLMAY